MFKVGDRVRCIEVPGYQQDILKLGHTYTITHLNLDDYSEPLFGLDGEEDASWFSSRFELIEQKPAQGYMDLFI